MKDVIFEMYWIQNYDNSSAIKEKILAGDYPFTPTEIVYDGNEYSYNDGMVEFNEIEWFSDADISFLIYGNVNGRRASLTLFIGSLVSERYVRVIFSFTLSSIKELETCYSYFSIRGVFYSYLNDYQDQSWQSETSISHYRNNNRPYEHLSFIVKGGLRSIDVSGNVGRSIYYCNVMFVAGATMYFGESFKFINIDTLLSLSGSKQATLGANNLIQVDLFDIFKDDISYIRERQRYFLETTTLFERLEYVKKHSIGFVAGLKKFGYT
ncbi:hypothetical protein [Phnomibacter sp. MR]|uniref:hypothetical protein n=1 Tax=Phnomibacter sp. MR TaxID=3042318 RepID=UPI003A7FC08D